jgi:hypothetical protein
MTTQQRLLTRALVVIASLSTPAARAQHAEVPPGLTHEEHLTQLQKEADLKKRGAAAMGFDQDKALHHFLLTTEGGVIQVEVQDRSDTRTLDAIRTHLRQVSESFANGNFDAPFATHAEVPPGVPVMQRLGAAITYTFEQTTAGARVRLASRNGDARAAIHEFLRYQIREHRTGDPL